MNLLVGSIVKKAVFVAFLGLSLSACQGKISSEEALPDGLNSGASVTTTTMVNSTTTTTTPAAARREFGGAYGYGYQTQYKNPIVDAMSCPSGFQGHQVFGTTYLDYGFIMCWRTLSANETPTYQFGGAYGGSSSGGWPNPFTGATTCDASKGFISVKLLGSSGLDNSFFYCYRNYIDDGAPDFNGIMGTVEGQLTYNLSAGGSCASGQTKVQVFGQPGFDSEIYICY